MSKHEDDLTKKTLLEIQQEIMKTSHEGRRREAIKEFATIGHDRSRATEDEILPLIETILRATTIWDVKGEYRGQYPSLMKFAGNEESLGTDGGDPYVSAAKLVRDFMRDNQRRLAPTDTLRRAGISKSASILEGLVARAIFRHGAIESK